MMKKKYIIWIVNIAVYGYLFYLFNPIFAEKGQWFSWQGTMIVILIIIISTIIELSGIWKKLGYMLQRGYKK